MQCSRVTTDRTLVTLGDLFILVRWCHFALCPPRARLLALVCEECGAGCAAFGNQERGAADFAAALAPGRGGRTSLGPAAAEAAWPRLPPAVTPAVPSPGWPPAVSGLGRAERGLPPGAPDGTACLWARGGMRGAAPPSPLRSGDRLSPVCLASRYSRGGDASDARPGRRLQPSFSLADATPSPPASSTASGGWQEPVSPALPGAASSVAQPGECAQSRRAAMKAFCSERRQRALEQWRVGVGATAAGCELSSSFSAPSSSQPSRQPSATPCSTPSLTRWSPAPSEAPSAASSLGGADARRAALLAFCAERRRRAPEEAGPRGVVSPVPGLRAAPAEAAEAAVLGMPATAMDEAPLRVWRAEALLRAVWRTWAEWRRASRALGASLRRHRAVHCRTLLWQALRAWGAATAEAGEDTAETCPLAAGGHLRQWLEAEVAEGCRLLLLTLWAWRATTGRRGRGRRCQWAGRDFPFLQLRLLWQDEADLVCRCLSAWAAECAAAMREAQLAWLKELQGRVRGRRAEQVRWVVAALEEEAGGEALLVIFSRWASLVFRGQQAASLAKRQAHEVIERALASEDPGWMASVDAAPAVALCTGAEIGGDNGEADVDAELAEALLRQLATDADDWGGSPTRGPLPPLPEAASEEEEEEEEEELPCLTSLPLTVLSKLATDADDWPCPLPPLPEAASEEEEEEEEGGKAG